MITARQLRMARAALDWTQLELAEMVSVKPLTIKRAEKQGLEKTRQATVETIEKVLTGAGIEFIDDGTREGAVLLKAKVKAKGKAKP